jgi:hypothetical protein
MSRMQQGQQLALFGKPQSRVWALVNWTTAYWYVVLCVACYASYLGAPPLLILATSALIVLPSFRKKTSTLEIAAHIVVALIFATFAHTVGWGIAGVIGT